VKNIISIDVEGSIEGKYALSGSPFERTGQCEKELFHNIEIILDLFEEHNVTATFFILGRVAESLPVLVQKIAGYGHEIGSHSLDHLFLYKLSRDAVKEQVHKSKSILEDVSSQQVIGFRAPFFSISDDTLFILDELKNAGYLYDSSIYPISGHDFYGIENAQRTIHTLGNGLLEMPLSTVNIFKRNIPVLGGGYFRLFPYLFNKMALKQIVMKERLPAFIYLHPYEIGGDYQKMPNIKFSQSVRYYHNSGQVVINRLKDIFNKYQFTSHYNYLLDNEYIPA